MASSRSPPAPPTSTGARGRTAVRRFYADYFIGHQAQDIRLELVSRTATADRVVDEMTISFTHDAEIPWVLPGVAPTGLSQRQGTRRAPEVLFRAVPAPKLLEHPPGRLHFSIVWL
jgi:hypothetical protein